MEYVRHNFRHAAPLLANHPAWLGLRQAIDSIDRETVIAEQQGLADAGRRIPKGGQTVMNRLFERLLRPEDGWVRQPRLFRDSDLEEWRMDFLRDRVGVEVSFNHSEAIPWQFTRLNIAGESERVMAESRIDVGVVICATASLKRWSRMDGAVGTFDKFQAWLREMRPILPIPILLIGLVADGWTATEAFAGTSKGDRTQRNVSIASDPLSDEPSAEIA